MEMYLDEDFIKKLKIKLPPNYFQPQFMKIEQKSF